MCSVFIYYYFLFEQLQPLISAGLPAEAANFLQQYLTAAGVTLVWLHCGQRMWIHTWQSYKLLSFCAKNSQGTKNKRYDHCCSNDYSNTCKVNRQSLDVGKLHAVEILSREVHEGYFLDDPEGTTDPLLQSGSREITKQEMIYICILRNIETNVCKDTLHNRKKKSIIVIYPSRCFIYIRIQKQWPGQFSRNMRNNFLL